MDDDRRAFYEYNAALMEPWDGPAAMAFTDGRQIGATLDRNGLRPARYIVTDDDYVILASEVGVLDIPERKIVKKWRLQPGKMLLGRYRAGPHHRRRRAQAHAGDREALSRMDRPLADCARHAARSGAAAGLGRAAARPAAGLRLHPGRLEDHPRADGARTARKRSDRWATMRRLPVLSNRPKVLYSYFKQLFAQVTNPPIDPIREELVDVAGHVHRAAAESARHRRNRSADAPRGAKADPERRGNGKDPPHRAFHRRDFRSLELDICYPAAWGAAGMEAALASLCAHAEDATRLGYNILIVSDRKASAQLMPIPALLATAAVHQHLVRNGLRTSTGLVVETGSAREVHHFALLAGYGAEAIHPYLALQTVEHLHEWLPQLTH